MKINIDASWVLKAYRPYFTDNDTNTLVFYGGSGSGKSHFIAQKIVVKALMIPNTRVLVIRKVGTSIRDSVWQLVKDVISQFGDIGVKYNESTFTMTFPNNSSIMMKGLEDPERIKSITNIHTCWLEEATELNYEDYIQLTLRLRSPKVKTQFLISYNPISKLNWVYQEFHADPPPYCKVIKTTYKDNYHLPKDYVDRLLLMEKRNPLYYKIYALGEFGVLGKLVIPKYTLEETLPDYVSKKGWFWVGMDFGYASDPNPVISGYYVPSKNELWITKELVLTSSTNDVIAKSIMDNGLGKERIVADSAEPKSIAELRQFGITRIQPAEKGPDSIRIGIDRINRNDIHVLKTCEHVKVELDNYQYKKDKQSGEYTNEPIDKYNHCIDAIRYGIQPVIHKKYDKDTVDDDLWLY